MDNIKFFRGYWNKADSGEGAAPFGYHYDAEELLCHLDREKRYNCLELACGDGNLYNYTRRNFSKYTGIDFSQQLLDIFQEKLNQPSNNVELYCQDAASFLSEEKYDIIHSNQLFQYLTLPQIRTLLSNNVKMLRKNGLIIHRGILDQRLKGAYLNGYLKPSFNRRIFWKRLNWLIYYVYKMIMRSTGKFEKMGMWYTVEEISKICDELELDYQIFGSLSSRYRFSLIIRSRDAD